MKLSTIALLIVSSLILHLSCVSASYLTKTESLHEITANELTKCLKIYKTWNEFENSLLVNKYTKENIPIYINEGGHFGIIFLKIGEQNHKYSISFKLKVSYSTERTISSTFISYLATDISSIFRRIAEAEAKEAEAEAKKAKAKAK